MARAEDLLQTVLHLGVALNVACAGVLLMRVVLRQALGAHAAYLAWVVVPCAMLATLAASLSGGDIVPVSAWRAALAPAAQVVTTTVPAPTGAKATWLAAGWVAGVVALLLLAAQRQRRFTAALRAGAPALAELGPVVVGVWRPRLWLPADFEQRFDAAERALILAHERVHLRRHDNAWNLFAFVLLATQWLNPLAWWAWHRMRRDQELSCDALALRDGLAAGDEAAPARYVNTLLKAQGLGGRVGAAPAGLATPFFSHPLVERIRVLKTCPASLPRRVAAARVVALTAGLLAAVVAAALESPKLSNGLSPGPAVTTRIEMQVDGRVVASPHLLGHYDQPMTVTIDDAGGMGPLGMTLELFPRPDDHVEISATLRGGADQQVFAKPILITRNQTPARVETTTLDGAHTVSLTFTTTVQTAPQPAR